MSKLNLWRTICVVGVFCALAVIGSPANTFTTLVKFNFDNGAQPLATLVQGLDGNFYGTTYAGGANAVCSGGAGCGTVFKITAAGKLTTLYSFCSTPGCTEGAEPRAGLIQATDGNFYGTTNGTVFKITPGGKLTTLYSFGSQPTDGSSPWALVQATDGNFYGTTYAGGANNKGTVFKITPGGKLTTLYSFCSKPGCTDGRTPEAGLVQATNGYFYGTTAEGGANTACSGYGCGTVFEITPGGKLTTLYRFCSKPDCIDGRYPVAGLVQATNGYFYGTTRWGGANEGGTVFKITPGGALTTLHSFNFTDGLYPDAGLMQGTDGNFYGTTVGGGAHGNYGTVFEITPGGTLATLYSFCSKPGCADGYTLEAGLAQATNGNFYGTTYWGGASSVCYTYGCGTVFSLATGLGPFVETLPTSGKVGTPVIILRNNLTGATSVTFNGTLATFKVISSTEITATVPSGATTGKVKVTTPSRALISNVNFRITPTIASFSPISGPVGTSVVINGQSFTGATSVTFGGVKSASFKVNSSTQITAIVPSGAKTGKITVTTPGGTATSNVNFRVTPTITGFSPISGPVGTSVVINGQGFTKPATVTFGGVKSASVTVVSATQIKAIVPTGAKTGTIAVTTSDGVATSIGTFTVTK